MGQPSVTRDPRRDAPAAAIIWTVELPLMSMSEPALRYMVEPASSRTVWSILTFISLALMVTGVLVPAISIPVSVILTAPLGPSSSIPVSVMLSL